MHSWSVIAAGLDGAADVYAPVAVVHLHRVRAVSPAAQALGVRRGQKVRDAQGLVPHMGVVAHDPGRDGRCWEPVVAAIESLAAGVEVVRPGLCVLAARGPAGWHGGEEAAGHRIVEHLAEVCGVEAMVGVADSMWAATLAARDGRLIPAGRTRDFLADLPVGVLGRPELADLLVRLGVERLGQFAALPAGDVAARFGVDGMLAHRLASGYDDHLLAPRTPPVDLAVEAAYDDPLERVDQAAFAARILAERLHQVLAGRGLACSRIRIEAVTAAGEEAERMWRHDGLLSAQATADRVRWQLDGWLTARARGGAGPTAGIARLRLTPDGLVTSGGHQAGLWGEAGEGRDRANRAAVRLQGLLGPEAVLTAVPSGGRGPAEQTVLIPWGDEPTPAQPVERPWPGGLRMQPSLVLPVPEPVEVHDADGRPVTVSGRARISARPAFVVWGRARLQVTGWAGPWPEDGFWWDPDTVRRHARCQLVLDDGRAVLVVLSGGAWAVEGIYE
ncbi:DNA polymerase Y family protein [Longispora sp. K20-0274]